MSLLSVCDSLVRSAFDLTEKEFHRELNDLCSQKQLARLAHIRAGLHLIDDIKSMISKLPMLTQKLWPDSMGDLSKFLQSLKYSKIHFFRRKRDRKISLQNRGDNRTFQGNQRDIKNYKIIQVKPFE